jgi:Fic family protein
MSSFKRHLIDQPVPPQLVRALTGAAESRGKQALWQRQSPQILEALRADALIESTVASNRIEGVTAPPDRIERVLEKGEKPRNRSEEELAGYKYVAEQIHTHHRDMTFTPNLVLQLHRDLFKYSNASGGSWKSVDNQITQTDANGKVSVRFEPVPAWQTREAMHQLHNDFTRELELAHTSDVLLVSAYVLDFLCIHPFLDGNGRLSRLITLLLLYQSGYEVGRWISLEKIIDAESSRYYGSLHESSQRWHTSEHDLIPWWDYFASIMLLQAYRTLEDRVGDMRAERGMKGKSVAAAVQRLGPVFRISEIEQLLPSVSRPTIVRKLTELKAAGTIEPTGRGRAAAWRKL